MLRARPCRSVTTHLFVPGSCAAGGVRRPGTLRCVEPLEGIAGADALLGRSFPLPAAPLPLVRWTEVHTVGDAVEVEWNLDDSRDGAPGRLALLVSPEAVATQLPESPVSTLGPVALRMSPLHEAQESLRPVFELLWEADGLHLRLTAQGPWERETLLMLAASVR